jgi:integrase
MWRAAFLTLLGIGLRIGELLALEWDDVNLEEGWLFVRSTVSRTKTKGLDIGDPKTESSKASFPIPSVVLEALKRHKNNQAKTILAQGKRFRVKADHNKLMQKLYKEHPRPDIYPVSPKECKCSDDEMTLLYKDDKRKIFRCEHCGREWQRYSRNLVFPSAVGTIMSPWNFQRKFYDLLNKAGAEHINLHGLRHTFATKLIEEGEDIRVVQALLRHAPGSKATSIYAHVTPKAQRKGINRMDDVLRREIPPMDQI